MFFASPETAEREGFRPCRRCRPRDEDPHAEITRRVCCYIEDHLEEPLDLETLSLHADLSPAHLQRVFKSAMGISPRQYADACRIRRFKDRLRNGAAVTGAIYDAGYGSGSRLYERADAHLGMTPTTYRRGGKGMAIRYAIAPCPLGRLLVAATDRGICAVSIGDTDAELESALRWEFTEAHLQQDGTHLRDWVDSLLRHLDGEQPRLDLPLDLRATAFQWRVWTRLRTIPYGRTRSYAEVAEDIGEPRAARAVARACATNPAALVIPCHRVVRRDGRLAGYRWGAQRKRALLENERSAQGTGCPKRDR
jgi:AraC family transcriptional regulator of adaptative response/methylated-DNA-[protein]-cysteine methyltransferase